MSFDLRIHFVGLVMWVPDGKTAMHVLMPSTMALDGGDMGTGGGGRHAGHSEDRHADTTPREEPISPESIADWARVATEAITVLAAAAENPAALVKKESHQHYVRLAYDTAYTKEGSTELTRDWVMVELANRVLDLTGLSSPDGIDTRLPGEIASLDSFADPVKRNLVEKLPTPPVAARVSMKAGALSDYELGAPFTFVDSDEPQRITSVTEWTIRGISSPADLEKLVIRGPGEKAVTTLPPLFPIGQTIHLTVYHMVSKEYPPHNRRYIPEAGKNDDHFDSYFDVALPREGGTKPSPPKKSPGKELNVLGDQVDEEGKHNPGSICGQAKASLA
jgi:hypothetical protein